MNPKTSSLHVAGLQKGNFVFADILDNSRVVSEDGKKKVGALQGSSSPWPIILGLHWLMITEGKVKMKVSFAYSAVGFFGLIRAGSVSAYSSVPGVFGPRGDAAKLAVD